VRWEVRPWRTAAGEIGGLVIFSEVITERKRAEAALRAAEEKYRHLVTESPDGIVVHRDGRAIYANPAALALFGAATIEALAGRDLLGDLTPEDERAAARDRARDALLGGHPLREGHVLRLDGRAVPVEILSCAVEVEGARAVQSVLRDITERKRVEAALRAQEAALARQRAVVDGVARIFREALTCPTEEGLGAACLAIAREVTQSRTGFIGEVAPAARRLQVVAGERGPVAAASLPLRGIYRRVLLRREVAVANDPGAVPHEAGGWAGAAPPRSFLAVPLLHAGRAVGLLGLADREGGFGPDQIAAAEALGLAMVQALTSKRAQEALRVADQRKTDFLAVLSHELRNPLAPIRNGIYLLDRAPPGSGQAQRAMDAIRRQTDQLTRLVDDLLDISRISHGKITLRRARLDAREVIRRACEDQQPTFDERGVVLVLSLPEQPVWLDADGTRLAQIATNLLSNAVKFTPRAGRVDVTLESAQDVSVLRVRDTGEGIEPHLLDHIFEPFAQAERTRGKARGGMGIGLTLVKSLAAMHGGVARARSEGPGRGAEFAVTLPLAGPPEAPREARPGARAPSGLSVLLVEDNRDAGETLREILELQGHRARLALDGHAGLAAFLEAVPDVVICDIGLPDMTGYEVVRRLRLLPGGATVLAVALTGYAQPEDVDAARAAGFDAHLAKPPPLEELDALLARASERRR
jgi:PAS domain S-box-containing protein